MIGDGDCGEMGVMKIGRGNKKFITIYKTARQ
jgi:hypothetical protein